MAALNSFLFSIIVLAMFCFLCAAVLSLYLRKVVQGWRDTLQAAHQTTDTWQRLHIPVNAQISTSITGVTSAPSSNGLDDITDPTLHGRYFGLSSTPMPEHHTSIYSSPNGSRRDGYQLHGLPSVEQAWPLMSGLAHESNPSAPEGVGQSVTLVSTPSSNRKKKCRLCSRVRQAVFGGS